ncbi:MAG: hypothetical protein AAF573_06050 [Bacteroidota bacterium]
MKKITYWANENRKLSILILIILHFITFWIYYFLGAYLYLENVMLHPVWNLVSVLLFFVALLFYPIKNVRRGVFKDSFFRRKVWQSVAILSIAMMVTVFGNHRAKIHLGYEVPFAQPTALDIDKRSSAEKELSKKEKRSLKRQLRKKIRKGIWKLRKYKKAISKGQRTALEILTILIAFGLLILILVLSCHIACAGSEGFALMFLIGGWILTIFGTVVIFRILKRKTIKEP